MADAARLTLFMPPAVAQSNWYRVDVMASRKSTPVLRGTWTHFVIKPTGGGINQIHESLHTLGLGKITPAKHRG